MAVAAVQLPSGEPPAEAAAQIAQEATAEAKEFQALQDRLKANKERISYLYRTMPIGFPQQKKAHMDEVDLLTAENEKLEREVFEKAQAAFISSDDPSMLTRVIMMRRLNSMIRPQTKEDQFNPAAALELVAAMREKFSDDAGLMLIQFLANYALERFEEADVVLREIESLPGAKVPPVYRRNLEETMEKYQRELGIRRFETNTDDLPKVRLITTEGDILVELFENHAPNTVANFIHLIRDQKFYDNKIFHLVKPGQYAQTGSPYGDGLGDAGYQIKCECDAEQIRHHFRGTLSMITQEKDQGGSQFIITHQPNTSLYDGRYTAFGRVIEGMDVVLKLKNIDLSGRKLLSADPSKILRTEIVRTRSHPYVPEKIVSRFGAGANPMPGATTTPQTGADAIDAPGSFDLLLKGDDDK